MAFNRVERIENGVALRRALISVYDKTGLDALVAGLAVVAPGLEILSTGGSHAAIAASIEKAGLSEAIKLVAVSDYTGQAEMAGGLVKTLDWKIYLGLLAEGGNPSHEADLKRLGAKPIDLVVGDLYPFEATAAAGGASVEELRQRIDIGGPAMLRAAAKNFPRVASISSPRQYQGLLEELRTRKGKTSLDYRLRLATAAFERVSAFDAAIAERLARLGAQELSAAYRIE